MLRPSIGKRWVLWEIISAPPVDVVPKGARAIIAGRFIDRRGKPVNGELDGRMIGLTLPELRAIPQRLCVAGGVAKSKLLALDGGYATIFVTDELTAQALLAGA